MLIEFIHVSLFISIYNVVSTNQSIHLSFIISAYAPRSVYKDLSIYLSIYPSLFISAYNNNSCFIEPTKYFFLKKKKKEIKDYKYAIN